MSEASHSERAVLIKLPPEDKILINAILEHKTYAEMAQLMWPDSYGTFLDEKHKRSGIDRARSRTVSKKIMTAVEKIRVIRIREKGLDASDTIPFTQEMVKSTRDEAMRILEKPIDVRSKYKELADPMLREKVILFYKTNNEKLQKDIICDIQDRAGYKPVEKIEHSAMDGKSVPELMNIIVNNFFGVKNIGRIEEDKKGVVEGEIIGISEKAV